MPERAWLRLSVMEACRPLIAERGVSKVARSPRGFWPAYTRAKGDPDRLGVDRSSGQDWRDRRNDFLARHVAQARQRRESWWKGGHPTDRHLALIAWAYTPTPSRLARYLGWTSA